MKPKYIASIPIETGPHKISWMRTYSGDTPPDDAAISIAAQNVLANDKVFANSEITANFTTVPELHVKRRRLFACYVTGQIVQLSDLISEDAPSDIKEN